MADLPEVVSMRDAEEADCPILTAEKSKTNGVYALKALPQARNDPLWLEIMINIQYSFIADVLVDPSANTELELPARKVMELQLVPVGRPVRTRGHDIMHFSPVFVTASFDRDGVTETMEAYLDVKCDKNEYDRLLQTQQENIAAGSDEGQVLKTPNQPINSSHATTDSSSNNEGATVIQLSPTHQRPHNAPLQQAVIGINGLRKLHLHLNGDQLHLKNEDEWVEDEEE